VAISRSALDGKQARYATTRTSINVTSLVEIDPIGGAPYIREIYVVVLKHV
jgi:hypothetical protein